MGISDFKIKIKPCFERDCGKGRESARAGAEGRGITGAGDCGESRRRGQSGADLGGLRGAGAWKPCVNPRHNSPMCGMWDTHSAIFK